MLKPNPDRDEYVYWSDVVDAPISGVMSRDEMKKHLMDGDWWDRPITEEQVEESLVRAGLLGHSLIVWESNGWGQYEVVRVEHQDYDRAGIVRHEYIAALTRAIDSEDWATVEKLVEEYDDE